MGDAWKCAASRCPTCCACCGPAEWQAQHPHVGAVQPVLCTAPPVHQQPGGRVSSVFSFFLVGLGAVLGSLKRSGTAVAPSHVLGPALDSLDSLDRKRLSVPSFSCAGQVRAGCSGASVPSIPLGARPLQAGLAGLNQIWLVAGGPCGFDWVDWITFPAVHQLHARCRQVYRGRC